MAAERFFKVLKDVLLLTEEVKRLNNRTEKLGTKLENIDKRLVRIETMAEMSMRQKPTNNQLPEKT